MGRYSKLPKLPDFGSFMPRAKAVAAAPRVHSVRRRLPAETIAQLVADYESGQPTTALMRTYGLGKGTVLSLLRGAGFRLRAQGQKNIDLDKAVQLYEAGWSLKRLGERFDCDAETVRKALRAIDVVLRPRNGSI